MRVEVVDLPIDDPRGVEDAVAAMDHVIVERDHHHRRVGDDGLRVTVLDLPAEVQHHEADYVEAVVDASIAELPMYFFYPHRMLRQCASTGAITPIGRGKTHLMGRLCMEHDIVAANVALPDGTAAGDVLIFCDAGGYDRSMSYVFGRG